MRKLLFILTSIILLAMPLHATDTSQYKVGSIGPAGGYVFYDKGFESNGWRYMEAAPKDLEGLYVLEDIAVDGTATSIGSGKDNTILISSLCPYEDNAAYACSKLMINGFDDWILPSLEELGLMYKTLKKNGIGSFSDSFYWTSSEACDGNDDFGYSFLVDFSNGRSFNARRDMRYKVRAIRMF